MGSLKFLLLAVIFLITINQPTTAVDVTYDGRAIKIDGERRIIISGSIHYPRSTPEMWPSLIKKAKEGGLNAIETYVFWNAHEPLYRQYDFSGSNDLIKFLKLIQDEGLYALLRIGPYVCAEWNFGGFPVWLKSIPNMTFRTQNDAFMYEMKNFTTKIVDMVKQENLFASEGGPIILAQIENEYGNIMSSYGNAGKSYINWCANFAETLDIGVPWIMCQQSDAPASMINTCNGYYCDQFWPNNKNVPKMWTENWSGWYKDWGGADPHRTTEDLAFAVGRFYQYGGSLQNYYMYHGGTNFGRTAGGPYITTAYDYDAPLNEYGDLNQPKWGHLKQLHSLLMSMEKVLTYGEVSNTDYGSMMSVNTQTTVIAKKLPKEAQEKLHYKLEWKWRAEHFEHLKAPIKDISHLKGVTFANHLIDQKLATNDTSDYLWYMTSVDINEDDPIWGEEVTLQVNCNCHVLHAFFNGKHIGTKWVKNGQYSFVFEGSAKPKRGTNSISLLSVTVGLPNYGAYFDKVQNGILGPVKLVAPNSIEKDLSSNEWAYKVGLNGLERDLQDVDAKKKRKWHPNIPFGRMFVWYKTTFRTPKGKDPIVLDLWGLGKGNAWVNGHDIGRYWPSFLAQEDGCSSFCDYRGNYHASKCLTNCGKPSQRWYHVPRSFLKDEDNTLVLFEEFGGNPKLVSVQTVNAEKAFAHAYEGNTLELSCHERPISKINFASFGNLNGTHGVLAKGSCHAPNSLSVVEKACIGKEKCSIDISEEAFGLRGCKSSQKRLAVEVEC
ncbi:hypothetical protein BUALT_Bualt09G0085200 [Buddleja alternifolia]|uniref:Beta-galactosidase n=1 Tax=Buddleja alternifolia TaxID=168488 RepID=A0AAV6X7N3_9LAMI|nr:hypothetical protein BUALT_Bualt09G0085200 [Buddleja alternifolia]